jgi:phosphate starvation-inducible PhoH-like protein
LTLAGVNDANLIELQRQTGIRVALRGDTLTLVGSADAVERATSVAQRMIDAAKQGTVLDADDVLRMSMDGAREPTGSDNRIVLPGIRKIIQPKTPGQAEYLGLIAEKRHRRGDRAGRNGQDLSGGRRRGRRAVAEAR